MKLQGALLLLGLVAGLVAGPDAEAARRSRRPAVHTHRGTVVAVVHKGGATAVVVRLRHQGRRGGLAAAGRKPRTRTFVLDRKTRVVRKAGHRRRPAGPSALRRGERVVIHARRGHAERVVIHGRQHPRKGRKLAAK